MTNAKSYLRQLKNCDVRINRKLEELEMLQAMVTKITTTMSGDVVSGTRNQDKLADMIAKIVDMQDEINADIDRYVAMKQQVSALLDEIHDADQFQVLFSRYVLYKTYEQIACDMAMTYRNVCYIHGRALQTVDELLKRKAANEVV